MFSLNHSYQDISLNLGETWTIEGTVNKDDSPIVIDNNTNIQWRLSNNKTLLMLLNRNSGITIVDSIKASYRIVIPVSQQLSIPSLTLGSYFYELSVIESNGTVTIQAEGKVTLNSSLRNRFPNI